MKYVLLFLEFLKIGLFAFGGGYGAIPLIRDCVVQNGWMDEAQLANMIAISESTPGPIMVNAATYIGNSQRGLAGAIVATVGVVLPAFMITVLVCALLSKFLKRGIVQNALSGIKPCLAGIILATGIFMAYQNMVSLTHGIVFACLSVILFGSRYIFKKNMSPILLICISAVIGIVFL